MEINKAAQAASSGAPTAVQLEAINNLAKAHLTAQQVLRVLPAAVRRSGRPGL